MKILYLDTSSRYLSLAVADNHRVLARVHRHLDRRHSTKLAALIEGILKKSKLSLHKLDGFCVSKGPGSFTGLRIGITTIKGLAFVLKKPVVAICSLDILAQNAGRMNGNLPLQICPLVDAKQKKVYTCLYQRKNSKIRRKSGYLLLPIEELLKKLRGEVLFLGDAILIYSREIKSCRNIKALFADEKFWYPRADQAVALGLERFRQGRFDDANSLVPLYLYPKECQIKRR